MKEQFNFPFSINGGIYTSSSGRNQRAANFLLKQYSNTKNNPKLSVSQAPTRMSNSPRPLDTHPRN